MNLKFEASRSNFRLWYAKWLQKVTTSTRCQWVVASNCITAQTGRSMDLGYVPEGSDSIIIIKEIDRQRFFWRKFQKQRWNLSSLRHQIRHYRYIKMPKKRTLRNVHDVRLIFDAGWNVTSALAAFVSVKKVYRSTSGNAMIFRNRKLACRKWTFGSPKK